MIIAINLLSLVIYLHSQNLSCDSCNVKLKNNKISGHQLEEPITKSINIINLYNQSLEKECPIYFSRTGGFLEN